MATIQEYKCPSCGGAIRFDTDAQKMKCPYCSTEFEMEALRELDEALAAEKPDEMNWENASGDTFHEGEEMAEYVCSSCGGAIVCEATTAATSCPFCGNPVVMTGNLSGALRPDLVIPFKLDKAAAKAGLSKHLSGKKLLPKVFSDQNHLDEIKGIYVPFWLFDADAEADMTYHATRTSAWSDSRYNYVKTSHFRLLRSGTLSFRRVPVDGSSKMPDDLMDSIEPYDFSQTVDFQTAYLAGFLADKYDVDAAASGERANVRIRKSTENAFADTARGYESVTPASGSMRLQGGCAHYALLPVWILNTTWNKQKYTFAMNGQTGKFVGNLPIDKGRQAGWFFSLLGIGALIAALIQFLIML